MFKIKVFDHEHLPSEIEKNNILDFLYENLENYGDPKADILKAMDYALKLTESFGGFILECFKDGKTVGAVIVNRTGMKDYIPENILVYIASHKEHRGHGIGKKLMHKAVEVAEGSIALHVEPDNPARYLYEKIGFTTKYIEMRYKKDT
ncbi:MAG: GNAT family N-acetyltransferase [Candidatus Delongbacteria bacterium]|nr:GNAT family N-acetyltransferase [Candidatus Delongbacteria bacterium]MCG2761147.1 GNAT family N-acetyltransferase [Candidatus Delongbacteria bacterium]